MIKTVSFAAMHFSIAFTVAYLLTGSVVVGGAVALVEPAVNTVAFYFHELYWRQREARLSHSGQSGAVMHVAEMAWHPSH